MELYINVHTSCKRALPNQMIDYKHAFLLHKLYNDKYLETDGIELNSNQILTTCKNKQVQIGNTKLSSRLSVLNGKIPLQDPVT